MRLSKGLVFTAELGGGEHAMKERILIAFFIESLIVLWHILFPVPVAD